MNVYYKKGLKWSLEVPLNDFLCQVSQFKCGSFHILLVCIFSLDIQDIKFIMLSIENIKPLIIKI